MMTPPLGVVVPDTMVMMVVVVVRYEVEHHGEYLYIITNKDGALNSKLVRTPGKRREGRH